MSGLEWVRSATTGRRVPLTPEDRRIMELLRADGRCSYRRIAWATGLSESTVRHRVNRMVNHGVFRVTIVTDPVAMGRLAARVHVRVRGRAAAEVAHELAALPETDFVALVTGRDGVVVDLVCDNHDHLVRGFDSLRTIEGVVDLDLRLILRVVKDILEW
ncbi:MAG: Lrp/AsnC family transcriptional regulator [Thermoleophilia bacterium]|nr:Lrp/AsnC family transcriptional regulator [Thermoleophilia bacterium]